MKLSLTAAGLLDPKRLDSWSPKKRRTIRKAVEAGMKSAGKEIAQVVQVRMRAVFNVRKAGFVKSMRHRLYAGSPNRFPALRIGSPIRWLGIHMRGGTVRGRMLIPLLPEHKRIGRRAFRRVVDALMRSGNAFFIERNGKVILMAENIRENSSQLRRFARAERGRRGTSIKRGQEIPIAVLVPTITLRGRFDLAGLVRGQMPRLAEAILRQLNDARD
jgi:hypothetical protein